MDLTTTSGGRTDLVMRWVEVADGHGGTHLQARWTAPAAAPVAPAAPTAPVASPHAA